MATMPADPFDLARFVDAQQTMTRYDEVLRELAAGCKRSHWMWFVFPQLRGLGHSPFAQRYGLAGLAEAQAYAAHPLLGARLRECTRQIAALPNTTAEAVFGPVDALKLRSCLTLFELADPAEPAYAQVLQRWYAGARDARTLALLGGC
jgi:uncharacterized protein (DUF1810 family)